MSLQVWLPLNGNTSNQGLNGLSMIGSPASWGNGKIGKCATFTGNTNNVIYNNTTELNYTDNFSFCLWVNHNYTGSAPQYAFTVGRADAGGFGYGLEATSSSNINLRFGTRIIGISCSANEWHHIALTVSGTTIKVYKDGALATTSTPATLPNYSDGNGLGLGCFHYSGDIYPYYGSLNDFRIYNHCLSAKEVKEISKGLLCHYKLNNKGFGNRNLVKGNFNCTSTSSTYTSSGSLSSILTADDFISNKGKILTLSCEIYSPGESKSSATDYRASRFGIHGSFNYTKTDGTKTQLYPFASLLGLGRVGKRYSESWTIPSDMTSVNSVLTFAIQTSSNSGFACPSDNNKETWWLKNVKLEWGSSPSAYSPANEDALYTSLGLNSTTEDDCSGYSRNANKVNSPSFSLGSPRYEGGCKFTGSEYLTFPNPLTSSSTDFSISCWVKFDNLSDTMTVCTMRSSVGSGIALFKIGSNFRFDDNTQTTFSNYSILVNTWLHLVVTRTSSSKNLYINGNLAQSVTTVGDMGGLHTTGSIGASSASGSGFGNFTKGVFSDFRIYSTALSASDIKELYNTSASVDKNGNMYAYEFKEE